MSEEKYEQMSLFDMNEDGSEGNAAGLHVVESHTLRSENTESTSANMVRCYAYSFLAVTVREPVELFQGFDSMKVITFSYDIGSINKLMKVCAFKDGEIILGAGFLIRKDKKMQTYTTEVLAGAKAAVDELRSCDRLVELAKNGDFEFRTPRNVLDHRKIYLLHSDDGRTRVITSSANMSSTIFTGDRMEHYAYCDSPEAYTEYMEDFDAIWEDSAEITDDLISTKASEDLVDSNPILKAAKDVNKVVVLKDPQEDEDLVIENIRYQMNFEKLKEKYSAIVPDAVSGNKTGPVKLNPEVVEKLRKSQQRAIRRQKIKTKDVDRDYPVLKVDYNEGTVSIDGKVLDLAPSEQEVRNDLDLLMKIFENYNDFIDPRGQLKQMHYRALVFIFASVFFAKVRCEMYITRGRTVSSLPLFLLITSPGSNCGKTFMVTAILKMMTGVSLSPVNKNDLAEICKANKDYKSTSDYLQHVQAGCGGTPYFIDEMDSYGFKGIRTLIKNPSYCENNSLVGQPLLIFASNDMTNPDETIRKRTIWLGFDAALPSNIDQNAYKGEGDVIMQSLGTAFYRVYLSRMLPEVIHTIDFIHNGDMEASWYPDLVKLSSQTIIDILKDYGYEVPEYMQELNFNDDYFGGNCVSEGAVYDIVDMYYKNRKAFKLKRNRISIVMGTDSTSRKRVENWKAVLPTEMKAEVFSTKSEIKLEIDRSAFEDRIGFRIGRGLSLRKKNKRP